MNSLIAFLGSLAIVFFISFPFIALYLAIKKNPKWKYYIAGMFASFVFLVILLIMTPTPTQDFSNNYVIPTNDKPISARDISTDNYFAFTKDEPTQKNSEITPVVNSQEPKPPTLTQYADKLYPIYESSKKEFQLITGFKGATGGIKQNHFEIQDQLNALKIGDRRYTNHTAIHSSLIEAHGYLVSLWQAYEDQNEKQIADFTQLTNDSFTQFENLSQKIKGGQIKDEYANY